MVKAEQFRVTSDACIGLIEWLLYFGCAPSAPKTPYPAFTPASPPGPTYSPLTAVSLASSLHLHRNLRQLLSQLRYARMTW